MTARSTAACVAAVALILLFGAAQASRELTVVEFPTPDAEISASNFYNNSYFNPKGVDIPIEQLAHVGPELSPDQVSLKLWTSTTMMISWATGEGRVGPDTDPPPAYDVDSVQSMVLYGTSADDLKYNVTGSNDGVTSKRLTYSYNYTAGNGEINGTGTVYQSPILHHLLVPNLTQGQRYFYRVGGAASGFSDTFNFTLPANAYPFTLGVASDPGQTANSSITLRRLDAANPDQFILIGDLPYADNWLANGTLAPWPRHGTDYFFSYQPKWDSWARMAQHLTARVPMASIGGNHEIEAQASNNNVSFAAFNARYPYPRDVDRINTSPNLTPEWWDMALLPHQGKFREREVADKVVSNNTYYSIQSGPILLLFLNNYVPYSNTSEQYKWFVREMEAVDRSSTPWVVAAWHTAWYHTYTEHYKEADEMRLFFEPLMKQYGIDMVFNGHVHAYDRSPPVYQYKPDTCGPIYVTIGDGGNEEGLYKQFVDQTQSVPGVPNVTVPAYCANTSLWSPASYQPSYSGHGYIDTSTPFCYASQAPWSDFRDPSFGHGTLTVFNATTARWTWNRNIDDPDRFIDDVIITKNPTPGSCSDKVVSGTQLAANAAALPYVQPAPAPGGGSPVPDASPAPAPSAPAPASGARAAAAPLLLLVALAAVCGVVVI